MTAMLILISGFLAYYITTKISANINSEIEQQANYIISNYSTEEEFLEFNHFDSNGLYNTTITIEDSKEKLGFKPKRRGNQYFQEFVTPYPISKKYLKISKEVTKEKNLLSNIYYAISILIILGLLFILYYAALLSSQLMEPVKQLTDKVSNMNGSILQPLKLEELSEEFEQLGESVNQLIIKINTSINYRKELYVGTAHELKTPLAVMRLKNQITLMKHKKEDNIRETLQQNMDSIDTLNSMIHNILEFGRAEGMQFEETKRINIIRFMAEKAEEFELLAHSQNRDFIYYFDVERFMINLQPLLFMQIFQNFIQNALKFTPVHGLVTLTVRTDANYFIVEIIDEGPGIDESEDLFAPFKRSLDSKGAGLGLFLAQNAAQSMGVKLRIENRKDRSGAIASILFPYSRFLHKDI